SRRYGKPQGLVVGAPGRVNRIGEHTDYNGGYVLPMAIEDEAWVAASPLANGRVEVYSIDFDEAGGFDVAQPEKGGPGWLEYVKGVAWALAEAGRPVAGWQGVIAGDVPLGAGLSSSAALEVAVATLFNALTGAGLPGRDLALLAQRAENAWVGVQCGIMDQLISAVGEAGHAVLIDCRSLEC